MKAMTRSEAESKRQKAVDFLHRIGNDDEADRFDSMTAEDYAAHKGARLVDNPRTKKRRKKTMARRRDELEQAQDDIGEVKSLLQSVYTPETGREDLAEAVGKALEVLEDYDAADNDDDGNADDDDD